MRPCIASTRLRAALAVFVVCLLSGSVRSESLAQLSLRYMVTAADAIVEAKVGAPGAGAANDRPCTITEVLRGQGMQAGQQLVVRFEMYEFGPPKWEAKDGEEAPQIASVLLFLSPPGKDGEIRHLYSSGVRALTTRGRILRPVQLMNPGGYYLLPLREGNWQEMLKKVRADIAEAQKAYDARDIADPARRNEALFEWVRDHQKEFAQYGGGRERESIDSGPSAPATAAKAIAPEGWGRLQYEPFYWIVRSNVLPDAWKALAMCDDLNDRAEPVGALGLPPPNTFASPEGRALLLKVVADKGSTDRHRMAAVRELSGSLWPHLSNDYPAAVAIDAQEQERIIRALLPLLDSNDPALPYQVVYAIQNASCPPDYELAQKMTSALPLEALKDKLGRARNGGDPNVITAIEDTIRRIEAGGKPK